MTSKFVKLIALAALPLCSIAQQNTATALTPKDQTLIALMPAQNKADADKAMEIMSSLNEEDVAALIAILNNKDTAYTPKLMFAIAAYSSYVMEGGKEENRSSLVESYCAAIENVTDKNSQQFFITQLQLIGKDDAVTCLQKQLADEQLGGPAARALAEIGTAAADKALLDAFKSATGANQLSLVEALGFAKYKPAAAAVAKFANSSDEKLQKLALYSLANIGDASSAVVLKAAAQKAKYTYSVNGATTAYFTYLKTLNENGGSAKAIVLATQLMKDAKAAGAQHSQIAALKVLVNAKQEKSTPDLQAAMKDESNVYRVAALKMAVPYLTPATEAQWLKTIATVKPEAGADIINMLGATKDVSLLPQYFIYLNNTNKPIRLAAIEAAGKTRSADVVAPVLTLIKTGDADEVEAGKQALLLVKSDNLAATIAGSVNDVPAGAKGALLQVLAARGDVNSVNAAFKTGNEATKAAAVEALSADYSAAGAATLLSMAEKGGYTKGVEEGYFKIITSTPVPDDQKLILLQNAMAIAQTDAQKNAILGEVGGLKSFIALAFAGKYLDSTATQQKAADAVINVALNNKDFGGFVTKRLLNKASAIITGDGSDKKKEAVAKYLAEMPAGQGFVSLFNGRDLSGWKGLVENPIARGKMTPDTLAMFQVKADSMMNAGWYAKDDILHFTGHGENICTVKKYGDFDMYVDWMIEPQGDAGIYLRGTPQVQIWDTTRRDVGAEVGSGGLYNNSKNQSKPLTLADNAIGDWNNFHIIMKGEKVTVYLNGVLVVDNVTLENYWDRSLPIFAKEQLELQAHGTHVAYRNIYVKDLDVQTPDVFSLSDQEKKEGYKVLFDGTDLDNWTGNKTDYVVDNGDILILPQGEGHGNLYTNDEYSDFVYRFEFQLTPGANNGLGIRAPLEGDAAYVGMELQILDNEAPKYANLKAYQYHGSVYGVIPAKRGFLKPTGEWNYEEVTVKGSKIKVVLNGTVILDGDIAKARKDAKITEVHPGLLNRTGHIGFLGHGDELRFRNIRIKDLSKK